MVQWLPLFSLGLLPVELLLLQLIFAAAEPGPAPKLEITLLWSIAVFLPQVIGGIQFPLGLTKPLSAVFQLPVLFWLDNRAGAFTELSPWQGESRLSSLLWSAGLLMAIQIQLRLFSRLVVSIKPNQNSAYKQSNGLNS
jgi:hypothetical protein